MSSLERKMKFSDFLSLTGSPKTSIKSILDVDTSLNRALKKIPNAPSSVYEIHDFALLEKLLSEVNNPTIKLAYRIRRDQNLDTKRIFLEKYKAFLAEELKSEEEKETIAESIPMVDISEEYIKYYEGLKQESKIIRSKRNRAARQKCLEESNYTCYVCGANFEKLYGEIGKGFLEVHHTKPLSTYDDEHEIDPSELCALCSNCHSMVHRGKDVMDVDKLKETFQTLNNKK